MRHRLTRLVILALLILVGAGTALTVWTIDRDGREREEQREAKVSTIERLLSTLTLLSAAQQAYADNPRDDIASLTRASRQVDQLTTDAAGLRAASESPASSERLEEFWTALSALMGTESRAHALLAEGDEQAAADTILAASRQHVARLDASLRAFRDAETTEYRRARAAAGRLMWTVLGGAAVVWIAGLVVLAVRPRREPDAPSRTQIGAAPTVDLAAAARLSTDLSCVSDRAALDALLARAADVLGARGIIIWVRAGDELVAAAAHGYEASMLRRIPAIARHADNATAAAWRSGEAGTVPEDSSGHGAIVAPMLTPGGCVGVFATELPGGRELDSTVGAVARMFAAQLAGVLVPSPEAGTAGTDEKQLDRQAAAS